MGALEDRPASDSPLQTSDRPPTNAPQSAVDKSRAGGQWRGGSDPDRLDTIIRVATPGAWLALGAIALIALASVIGICIGEVGGVSIAQALFG